MATTFFKLFVLFLELAHNSDTHTLEVGISNIISIGHSISTWYWLAMTIIHNHMRLSWVAMWIIKYHGDPPLFANVVKYAACNYYSEKKYYCHVTAFHSTSYFHTADSDQISLHIRSNHWAHNESSVPLQLIQC